MKFEVEIEMKKDNKNSIRLTDLISRVDAIDTILLVFNLRKNEMLKDVLLKLKSEIIQEISSIINEKIDIESILFSNIDANGNIVSCDDL